MMFAPTKPAALDQKTREALRKVAGSVAVEVRQAPTPTNGKLKRILMAKQNVTPEYHKALLKFAERLQMDQQNALDESGHEGLVATAVIETGRKFDKVMLATIGRGRKTPPPTVMYFVERSTGVIFGPKSPAAPNTNQMYGHVENAAKWDWSGETGVPVSDETVEEVGGYGKYRHYQFKSQSEAVAG